MSVKTLPIFPLQVVLFPGVPQPLHVFEPQYRQMLADCLEGDRRFGISFVSTDTSGGSGPQEGSIGCTAAIEQVWPLPDGRSNLLAMGEQRFELREYLETDRLYRVALVEPFDDDAWEDGDADLPGLADAVQGEFHRFTRTLSALTDKPLHAEELPDEAAALSFHVAAALDIDLSTKQELLESRSPRDRLERLASLLRAVTEDLATRASVHQRAKRNGRGHAQQSDLQGR
jgi:Lon protease-like protein